jgi:hypothetical protein
MFLLAEKWLYERMCLQIEPKENNQNKLQKYIAV